MACTMGVENRCVVFALDEGRPLAWFAGIWTNWSSVRKVKEGETTNDNFAFPTADANTEVGAIHPKAIHVLLTTSEEVGDVDDRAAG
jgi:putative SOS response-associated peptidase YedK